MNKAPTTRDSHALRWVLGVGLVFVVVVAMALQVARQQADERWVSVLSHCQERELLFADHMVPTGHTVIRPFFETRGGGNIFRAWRQIQWKFRERADLVVRQERSFFGSSIEARMSRGRIAATPELVDFVRETLAGAEVALIVDL